MTTHEASDRRAASGALTTQLFAAAWMAVALAFALEALTALGAFTLGRTSSAQVFLASVGQKIGWGTLVCVGLAFAKAFKPKDAGAAAWAGILGAPAAFTIARAIHKGLAQAMGFDIAATAPMLLLLLATIKALEYGVLGAVLARLDERSSATVGNYLRTGCWVAVVFGGAALGALAAFGSRSPTAADWLARAINELLFPIGCALILFAASAAGKRLNA
jgi:hypothetical protein